MDKKIKKAYLDLEKLRIFVAGKRKGYTLADRWNVSRSTVQRRLSGESRMTLEQINEVCETIEMSIDEFLEIKKAA